MSRRPTETSDKSVRRERLSRDAQFTEQVLTLYNELIAVRNRLAFLPPVTGRELELCQMALHEVAWLFMTPPRGAATGLPLPEETKRALRHAAEDRSHDLYVTAVALIALKLGRRNDGLNLADDLDAFTDLLDTLSFDHRRPKRATVETLRRLKTEIDARISHVTQQRAKGFAFPEPVEPFSKRKNKKEKPDQFFRRVYARYVPLGLTQADIRKADPAYYNVFHVWCSRNRRSPERYAPSARPRRS